MREMGLSSAWTSKSPAPCADQSQVTLSVTFRAHGAEPELHRRPSTTMFVLAVAIGSILLSSLSRASQLPLGDIIDHPLGFVNSQKASESVQAAALNALSADDFTSFTHPAMPSYGLRIKKTPAEFCDPTVKSYTGYLDVDYGTKHMFFYFFESRNDPDADDVLMWINGGPGCSKHPVRLNISKI